jgi:hypothetical protein
MIVIETFYDEQRTYRVEVFQRADGTFGFQESMRLPEGWMPLSKQPVSIVDTLEHAQAEARERIPWLKNSN